jgi:hypothetical protein
MMAHPPDASSHLSGSPSGNLLHLLLKLGYVCLCLFRSRAIVGSRGVHADRIDHRSTPMPPVNRRITWTGSSA